MTLNFDKEVIRKLWDYYYVPYIKGYFSSSGRFRSDDIKTGNILAYVGSTSSASFFPNQVTTDDSEGHAITMKALPCPEFEMCIRDSRRKVSTAYQHKSKKCHSKQSLCHHMSPIDM